MAATVRLTVTVQGQRELMRKLKGDELLAGPWSDAMKRAGEAGLSAARGAAPVASGLLRSKLVAKVQAKPVPMWVAVRATATRTSAKSKRYPYPKRVEYDRRLGHSLWMTNALKGATGRIQAILEGAARAIETKWGT